MLGAEQGERAPDRAEQAVPVGHDGVHDRLFRLLCLYRPGGGGTVLDLRQPVFHRGDVPVQRHHLPQKVHRLQGTGRNEAHRRGR